MIRIASCMTVVSMFVPMMKIIWGILSVGKRNFATTTYKLLYDRVGVRVLCPAVVEEPTHKQRYDHVEGKSDGGE
jgi:hypothetical protein